MTDTPAPPIPEPRILETACEWTAEQIADPDVWT